MSIWQKPFRGIQVNKTHPLADGLACCWVMNEGSGDKIFDLSGNGNDGIFAGTPVWSPGRTGPNLHFPTGNNRVDTDYLPDASKPISGACWIKFDVIGSRMMCCGTHDGEDHRFYFGLGISPSGAAFWGLGASYTEAVQTGAIAKKWHHIAITGTGGAQGGVGRYYFDGKQIQTFGYSQAGVPTAGHELVLACTQRTPPINYLEGSIDLLQIYERTLTADEIAWLYREPYAMFEQPSRAKYFYEEVAPPTGILTQASHYYRMRRAA